MSMSGNRNGDVNSSTPLPMTMEGAASPPLSLGPPSAFPPPAVSMPANAGLLAETNLDWTAADATFGPNVFERRRQLWARGQPLDDDLPTSTSVASGLDPSKSSKGYDRPKRSNPSVEALKRLDDILASPNVDADDEIWKSYLSDVHHRLVGGNRLRKGLKLSQAVSNLILFALFSFSLECLLVDCIMLSIPFPLFAVILVSPHVLISCSKLTIAI